MRSSSRFRNLSDVCCVGLFCPSASDCPNNAVRYDVYSFGLMTAFRRLSILRYDIIDEIECTCNLVRKSLFGSFVRCAGDRAILRIIRVCVASILCSCVRVRVCASRAYVNTVCTSAMYNCMLTCRGSSLLHHILCNRFIAI